MKTTNTEKRKLCYVIIIVFLFMTVIPMTFAVKESEDKVFAFCLCFLILSGIYFPAFYGLYWLEN